MNRGFTLIELLVVIAIIMVLIGILIPAVAIVRKQSRIAETRQIILQVLNAVDLYQHAIPGGLPLAQTGPSGYVDQISGRGEQSPGAPDGNPLRGRLLDQLREGGTLITTPEYLGPRAANGLVSLLDGWRQPLYYQIADPRSGVANELNQIDAFWKDRTRSQSGRPYAVVYSVGPQGPAEVRQTGQGWWQHTNDIVTVPR